MSADTCWWYLVLPGDVALVSFLHLFEFVLQTLQLNLHFLHKLQIPLSPPVENLDGQTHVLHLSDTEASAVRLQTFNRPRVDPLSLTLTPDVDHLSSSMDGPVATGGVFIPFPEAGGAVWSERLWSRWSAGGPPQYKHSVHQSPGQSCRPASRPPEQRDPPSTPTRWETRKAAVATSHVRVWCPCRLTATSQLHSTGSIYIRGEIKLI